MGVLMRDEGRMETEDIILGKAKYEDWRSIYQNVWSRPETAEYGEDTEDDCMAGNP